MRTALEVAQICADTQSEKLHHERKVRDAAVNDRQKRFAELDKLIGLTLHSFHGVNELRRLDPYLYQGTNKCVARAEIRSDKVICQGPFGTVEIDDIYIYWKVYDVDEGFSYSAEDFNKRFGEAMARLL